MTQDIATLLTRNLHEVFGEGDADRRRKAVDEIFNEDAVFYELQGIHRGRDEIARIAGIIRDSHPDFRYTVTHPAEQLHDTAGRIRWVSGKPGEPPAYAGTDIAVARDGKIAAIYLFFDQPPG
ncbi:MAG: nuclear transport factor 2 family protein [Pararhizobium sp.]